jgi:orotidine-5'-phosphate decarboxylase
MNFTEKLAAAVHKNHSRLCVGLDPAPDQMPDSINVHDFCKAIIDATSDLVCAYKPNFAFFEAMGRDAVDDLQRTIIHIPKDIVVIGDAKRGDIGNTSKAYAKSIFEYFGCDAATVSPYLGFDSIEPFLNYHDKGVFILCRTSNAGAADFQSLKVETEKGPRFLYEMVAEKANSWNKNGNVGLVVGATAPGELKLIRELYPEMHLLIPGVGAQGGDIAQTVRNGFDARGERTIINSSRQILYASRGKDFASAARSAARNLLRQINEYIPG